MKSNIIETADERVSIALVCRMLGVDLPDDVESGRSRKVHCPFGSLYHSDGGVDPAMRVYPDTNSAYCFSCRSYFTPVGLTAKALDVDRRTAALRLLDRIGHRSLDPGVVWRTAADFEAPPDRALLAEALKTFCRRVCPDWATRQFDRAVSVSLTRCLGLLDLVRTDDDVGLWLGRCKKVMRRALHIPDSS